MASPGNDTDVKIASKAVAIKSNTRLKKLVRVGDLLKMEANKKKKGNVRSQDVFSGYLPRCNGASQASAFYLVSRARKRNEEQIERNSIFTRRWNKISHSLNTCVTATTLRLYLLKVSLFYLSIFYSQS